MNEIMSILKLKEIYRIEITNKQRSVDGHEVLYYSAKDMGDVYAAICDKYEVEPEVIDASECYYRSMTEQLEFIIHKMSVLDFPVLLNMNMNQYLMLPERIREQFKPEFAKVIKLRA